jgi:hypothetical protein
MTDHQANEDDRRAADKFPAPTVSGELLRKNTTRAASLDDALAIIRRSNRVCVAVCLGRKQDDFSYLHISKKEAIAALRVHAELRAKQQKAPEPPQCVLTTWSDGDTVCYIGNPWGEV